MKMKNRNLEEWVQGIGLLGVIGSLIFVGLQLKQGQEVAIMDMHNNAAERNAELSIMIAENAEVWHRACIGDTLSESESLIAGQIYWNYLQLNWNNWNRMRSTSLSMMEPQNMINALAANIHRYPGFEAIARSYTDWRRLGSGVEEVRSNEYRQLILARVAKLEELEPEPHADVTWCGAQ